MQLIYKIKMNMDKNGGGASEVRPLKKGGGVSMLKEGYKRF